MTVCKDLKIHHISVTLKILRKLGKTKFLYRKTVQKISEPFHISLNFADCYHYLVTVITNSPPSMQPLSATPGGSCSDVSSRAWAGRLVQLKGATWRADSGWPARCPARAPAGSCLQTPNFSRRCDWSRPAASCRLFKDRKLLRLLVPLSATKPDQLRGVMSE